MLILSLTWLISVVDQVFDAYKRPTSELSPAKAAAEDISHWMDNKGVQLLGQIRHGSCRPRAILFKVLADSVGLESKLVVVICHFFNTRIMLLVSPLTVGISL